MLSFFSSFLTCFVWLIINNNVCFVRKASPPSDMRTNFLYHNVVKRDESIYLKTLKSCDDMQ